MSFYSRDFNSRIRRTNQASIFESLYGSEAGGSETGSQHSTQTLPMQYSQAQLPVSQARKTLSSIGERSGRFDQQYSLHPLSFRREAPEDLEVGSPRAGNAFRSVDLEELDGDDDSPLPPSGDLLEDIGAESGGVENVSLRTQKWIEEMSTVNRASTTSRKQPNLHRIIRRQPHPKLKRQRSGPMPQNPYNFGDILEVTKYDKGNPVESEDVINMEESTGSHTKITKKLEASEHEGAFSDDLPEYLEEDPPCKVEVKITKVESKVEISEGVKDEPEDQMKCMQVDKTSSESPQVETPSSSKSDEPKRSSSEKELDENTDYQATQNPAGLKEEAEAERRDKTNINETFKQKVTSVSAGGELGENNEISFHSCDSFIADVLKTTLNEKPAGNSAAMEKHVKEETDRGVKTNTRKTMNQKPGGESVESNEISLKSCDSFVADVLNTTFNEKDELSTEGVTEETDNHVICSEMSTLSVSQDDDRKVTSKQDVLEFKKSDVISSTPNEAVAAGCDKNMTSTNQPSSLKQICQSYMGEAGGSVEGGTSGKHSSLWAFQVSSLESREESPEEAVVKKEVEPESSFNPGVKEACLDDATPTESVDQEGKQGSDQNDDVTSSTDPRRKRRTDINWSPKSKPEAEKRPRLEGDKLKNDVKNERDLLTSTVQTRDSSTYTDGGRIDIDAKNEETTCKSASKSKLVDSSTNTTYLEEMIKKTKLVDGWTQYDKVDFNSDNSTPVENIGSASTAGDNDFENVDVNSVLLPEQPSPSDGVRRRNLLNSNVDGNESDDDYDDEVRNELSDFPCCCGWRSRRAIAGGIIGGYRCCNIL